MIQAWKRTQNNNFLLFIIFQLNSYLLKTTIEVDVAIQASSIVGAASP